VPRWLEGSVRRSLGLALDADQGVPGGIRDHLAAGVVSPVARGPVAAAVLAGPGAVVTGPAGTDRRGQDRHYLSSRGCWLALSVPARAGTGSGSSAPAYDRQ